MMLTSGFIGFGTAVCRIHSKMSAIDLMSTKIADGTLGCFHVIVLTETKPFLSSSLSVCHQPAKPARLMAYTACLT